MALPKPQPTRPDLIDEIVREVDPSEPSHQRGLTDDSESLPTELNWSTADAMDTRARLRPFADEWGAPEMDAYDDL